MSPHRFTRAQFAAGSAAALGGIALRTAPARAAGY